MILYDIATGVRIGTPISIPDDETNWIALSLDGRWLSTGGEADDGQHAPQIWNLDPQAWSDAACRIAGRNLTREEWTAHIGSLAPYRATCRTFPMLDPPPQHDASVRVVDLTGREVRSATWRSLPSANSSPSAKRSGWTRAPTPLPLPGQFRLSGSGRADRGLSCPS